MEAPCDGCYPGIHEYNESAYTLYMHVADQFIMGPSGPIGLNLLAIDRVCDYFSVALPQRSNLIRKVQIISSSSVATQMRRAKARARS